MTDSTDWTLGPQRIRESGSGWAIREVPGGAIYYLASAGIGVFVPKPAEGADAPHHVCDHGFAARTCGLCNFAGRS